MEEDFWEGANVPPQVQRSSDGPGSSLTRRCVPFVLSQF